jgi:hypothetical protein
MVSLASAAAVAQLATPSPPEQAAINTLKGKRIITGVGFHPELATSQGQFVSMLMSTLVGPQQLQATASSAHAAGPYGAAFAAAANAGVIQALPAAAAKPGRPMTREDAAVLAVVGADRFGLLRSGPRPPTQLPVPSDIGDVSPGKQLVVEKAIFYGLIPADPTTRRFRPKDWISQADSAVTMVKLLDRKDRTAQ